MKASTFDIAVIGSGPIGASTAFALAKRGAHGVIVLTAEPNDRSQATYRQAGGSIRWSWDDPVKANLTSQTAQFIQALLRQKVDLAAIENEYHFLQNDQRIPALNVSGAKLVAYLLEQAAAGGVQIAYNTPVHSLKQSRGQHELETTRGTLSARRVVVAAGAATKQLVPTAPVTFAKRQLFVLQTATPPDPTMPHTIIPFGSGVIYVFVKRLDGAVRLLLGQEDVLEHSQRVEPDDHFTALIERGLGDAVPQVRAARVERILWGFDATNKTPMIHSDDDRLWTVNCGSAIRSSIGIGQQVADRLRD